MKLFLPAEKRLRNKVPVSFVDNRLGKIYKNNLSNFQFRNSQLSNKM